MAHTAYVYAMLRNNVAPVGGPVPRTPLPHCPRRIVHRSLSPRDNDSEKLLFPTLQRITSARGVEYIQDTMRSRGDGDDSRLVIRTNALDVKSDLRAATLHSAE